MAQRGADTVFLAQQGPKIMQSEIRQGNAVPVEHWDPGTDGVLGEAEVIGDAPVVSLDAVRA